MPDANLNIKIRADGRQAQSELSQLSRQLSQLKMPAAAFGRTSGMLGNVGSLILGAGGLGAGVAGALGASIKASLDFNDAFADVIRVVDDADKVGGFGKLKQSILDLSTTIPVPAKELAGIAAMGGQMNVAADEMLPFIKTVATLGRTTKINTEEAAQGLGKLANITHNRNWEQMASTIVAVGKINVGGEQDVMNISERLAPVLGLEGVSLPGIAAIGAAVLDTGIESEMGSSAVARAFLQMQDAVSSSAGGIVGNTKEIRDAVQHVGDLGEDLDLAQMQQGEMYTKKGKLKKQFRQHPSEVRAMDLRIQRLQREKNDTAADLDDKRHPGQAMLATWAGLTGQSTADFSASFKSDAYGTFRKALGGLHDKQAAGEDIFQTLDKLGINNIREIQTIAALAQTPEHLDTLFGVASAEYANTAAGAATPAGFVSALAQGADTKFNPANNPLAGQIIAQNKLNALEIVFADTLVPGVIAAENAAVDGLKKLIDSGKSVADILEGTVNLQIGNLKINLDQLGLALVALNGVLGTGILGTLIKAAGITAGGAAAGGVAAGGGAAAVAGGSLLLTLAGVTSLFIGGISLGKLLEGNGAKPVTQGDLHPPVDPKGPFGYDGSHPVNVDMTVNVNGDPSTWDLGKIKDDLVRMLTGAAKEASAPNNAPVNPGLAGGRY